MKQRKANTISRVHQTRVPPVHYPHDPCHWADLPTVVQVHNNEGEDSDVSIDKELLNLHSSKTWYMGSVELMKWPSDEENDGLTCSDETHTNTVIGGDHVWNLEEDIDENSIIHNESVDVIRSSRSSYGKDREPLGYSSQSRLSM